MGVNKQYEDWQLLHWLKAVKIEDIKIKYKDTEKWESDK